MTIRIDIPQSIAEKDLRDYLLANSILFRLALNGRAKDHDPRSEVDTIRITDIKIDSHQAIIFYEVDFCLQLGCQDLTNSDTHRRRVTAHRQGNCFSFEQDTPPESRTTGEEF